MCAPICIASSFLAISIYRKPTGTRQCNHHSLYTLVLSTYLLCSEFPSLEFFQVWDCVAWLITIVCRRLQPENEYHTGNTSAWEPKWAAPREEWYRVAHDTADDQNWQKLEYWLGPEHARWPCELARSFDLRLERRVLHNACLIFLVVSNSSF
jgi:hypothetical protein